MAAGSRKRLGEILIDAGVLDEDQLKSALAEQRRWGGKLGPTLVEMGFVDEGSLVFALSRQLKIPAVDLEAHELQGDVREWLRLDLAEKYAVFPLSRDRKTKTLQIATTDPTNYEAEKELMFHTGMRIQLRLAGPNAIERAIRKHYYDNEPSTDPGLRPKTLEPSTQPGIRPKATEPATQPGVKPQKLHDYPPRRTKGEPSTQPGVRPRGVAGSASFGSHAGSNAAVSVGPEFRADEPTFDPDELTSSSSLLMRLVTLERQTTSQQVALRAVLELLEEKGHLPKSVADRLKRG